MIEVFPVTGKGMQEYLSSLAELRIAVFKEWPYLYDGSLEYERKYLDKFSHEKNAILVIARDGQKVIGASTASPLLGHADEFAAPFLKQGCEPEKIFYFGESVLLPEYRGKGIGRLFFQEREAHAKSLNQFDLASFCAVVRDPVDSRKPSDYKSLELFWDHRGFEKAEGLTTNFLWKEEESGPEIDHKMQFWIKKL